MKLLIVILLFYSSVLYSKSFKKIEFSTRNSSISGTKIKEESISLRNLNIDGQKQGDVLYFNKGMWDSYPISGLNYLGEWDCISNSPELSVDGKYINKLYSQIDAVAGDYFIISVGGIDNTLLNTEWGVGDWIIYNGNSWDKISNSGDIKFIFGRTGEVSPMINDYTWEQIEKSTSKLLDISNTPNTLSIDDDGKVLKWSNIHKKWVLADDKTGIGIGNVQSSDIASSSITNEDINDNASITNTKIDGLENTINSKLNKTGGSIDGDLILNQYNLDITDGAINGVEFNSVFNKHNDLKTIIELEIGDKENLFMGVGTTTTFLNGNREWVELNSDLIKEGENKFFSEGFVINTKLKNYVMSPSADSNELIINSPTSIIGAFGKIEKRIQVSLEDFVINPDSLSDITLNHFATSGVNDGYLYFDAPSGNWIMKNITGLEYRSTWDASSGEYPDANSLSAGDYYIVSSNGNTISDDRDWINGDWAVYNGTDWLRINNSGAIFDFNSRTGSVMPESGDYTWSMIDKTDSSINDLSNVITVGAVEGQVLKWSANVEKWLPEDDETGIEIGVVNSTAIADFSISDKNISNEANIDQSKINNLQLDLSKKLSLTGGDLTGDLNLGTHEILGLSTINGFNISDLVSSSQSTESLLLEKENAFPSGTALQYLNGNKVFVDLNSNNIPDESINNLNLYLTNDRILKTPVGNEYQSDDSSLIVNTDNLIEAIGKLEAQLKDGVIPDGIIGNNIQIEDKSIGLGKLSKLDVPDGHTFKFTGEKWVLSSLTGINYKGNLNLSNNDSPSINSSNGDYYIITGAGSAGWSGDITWNIGDWAIFDKDNNKWQQIGYADNIVGFQGASASGVRTGKVMPQSNDYSWSMLNFENTSIELIADVDTSGVLDGNILKWNGNKWAPAEDLVGFEEVISANIEDGTIESTNFEENSIHISDFTTLQSILDSYLLNKADDQTKMNGGLNLNSNSIINADFKLNNNSINLAELKNSCESIDTSNYQPKLNIESGTTNTFINGKGDFVSISLNDIITGEKNLIIDPNNAEDMSKILDFELNNYSIYSGDQALTLSDGDSLLQAFGKIEKGINNVVLGSESSGYFDVNNDQILLANDDKKLLSSPQAQLILNYHYLTALQMVIK